MNNRRPSNSARSTDPADPHPRRAAALILAALVSLASLATVVRAHSPHDVVTHVALSPDFANDETVFAYMVLTGHRVFARSTDGGRSWEQTSPAMAIHGIEDFGFSPDYASDRTAFAATLGGVYRTTDAGLTWAPVNTGLGTGTGTAAFGIAVSPNFATDDKVVLATDRGAYVSNDRGDSWIEANTGIIDPLVSVVGFSPDGATIFVGDMTLHRSINGGASWQPTFNFTDPLISLDFSPLAPDGSLLAVTFGRLGGGVLVSVDGGQSFQTSNDNLTDDQINDVRFAPDGSVLAAAFAAGSYVADGPFQTWSVSTTGLEELSALTDNHFRELAISPTFSSDGIVFMAAYEGLFRSDDGGTTWEQLELYTQRVCKSVHIPPGYASTGTFFLGAYGGGIVCGNVLPPPVFEPAPTPLPGGTTINTAAQSAGQRVSAGPALAPPISSAPIPGPPPEVSYDPWATGLILPYSAVLEMSTQFETDGTMFYGYTELYRTNNGGQTWVPMNKPPGVVVVRAIGMSPDFDNDRIVFLGSTAEGTFRSDSGGGAWTALAGGLPVDLRSRHVCLSPDFVNDGTVFIASKDHGVARSTDGGDNWTLVGLGDDELRAFAISPDFAFDRTAFAGRETDGLYITTDGGDTWTAANHGLPTDDVLAVESIVVSPDYAVDRTVLLVTLDGTVFRSVNGGTRWVPATVGPGSASPRAMAISPDFAADQTLLLTNHDWVYRSRDGGDTWSRLPGYARVDDDHQAVRHTGSWLTFFVFGAGGDFPGPALSFGPGTHRTQSPGDSSTFTFFGDSVEWYALLNNASGIAEVTIDDGPPEQVDLYVPVTEYQQRVFSTRFDSPGWHTIQVTATGLSNPSSSGITVHSDGFGYTF